MARPEKCKRVCSEPANIKFFSQVMPDNGTEESLTIEQFETIRLIDYVGLTQEQCATQMNVARTTVQRLYTDARYKLAEFLVKGATLTLRGGNYQVCEHGERCCQNYSCPRMTCGCTGEFDSTCCETYHTCDMQTH